jgi:hypothetical protein
VTGGRRHGARRRFGSGVMRVALVIRGWEPEYYAAALQMEDHRDEPVRALNEEGP